MSLLIDSGIYKQILVTNDDYIYKNSISKNEFWDFKVCDTIAELITQDSEFIDIGANIGLVSLATKIIALQKFKTIKKIHCFEPNNEIFSILKKNTTTSSSNSNFELYQLALSNTKSHLCNMKFHPQNNGCSFISKIIDKDKGIDIKYKFQTHDHLFTNEINVNIPTLTLDSLIYRFSNVSVVKIDVEGFECFVLEGAKDFLQTFKPHLIIEVLDENVQHCHALLHSYNYSFVKNIDNQDYLFSPNQVAVAISKKQQQSSFIYSFFIHALEFCSLFLKTFQTTLKEKF